MLARGTREPGKAMNLTNDSYIIVIHTKSSSERYYRDKAGWLKVSTRGRKFRATAEQVLNLVLPTLAKLKPNVTIEVEHYENLGRRARRLTNPARAPGTTTDRRRSSPAARTPARS
jgi:hypothetical protein